MEPFFFPTTDALNLFGVWRGPATAARVWLLCPPFAEEEKSARRVLTQIAQLLEARGEASLIFSYRGTGDSEGDFETASLSQWSRDLEAVAVEAKKRASQSKMAILGVRIGASLALLEAEKLGAKSLILIEPLLSGRSFLMQQSAKKQLRAQLTGEMAGDASAQPSSLRANDMDGWALGESMRAELTALDLKRNISKPTAKTTIFQVGPRPEVAPPLQSFANSLGASSVAAVMQPFWNLIDYADPAPLLALLEAELNHG